MLNEIKYFNETLEIKDPIRQEDGSLISAEIEPDLDVLNLKKEQPDDTEIICFPDPQCGDKISKNFILADLTSSPLFSSVPCNLEQNGLTAKEITKNLINLAQNVLEPLKNVFGKDFIITSGLRKGEGKSQHLTGQAVDISFTFIDKRDFVHRAAEISMILPDFDYIILEYIKPMPIIHISFNKDGNKRKRLTTKDYKKYYTGFRDEKMGLVYSEEFFKNASSNKIR